MQWEYNRDLDDIHQDELKAKLIIVHALEPLTPSQRLRVFHAINYILLADSQVTGAFRAMAHGLKSVDHEVAKRRDDNKKRRG